MRISEFQELIEKIYVERDSARGLHRTFLWLVEEVGELSNAVRKGNREAVEEEVADVLAWLCTVATLLGVNVEDASIKKYGEGCPVCGRVPCSCPRDF